MADTFQKINFCVERELSPIKFFAERLESWFFIVTVTVEQLTDVCLVFRGKITLLAVEAIILSSTEVGEHLTL